MNKNLNTKRCFYSAPLFAGLLALCAFSQDANAVTFSLTQDLVTVPTDVIPSPPDSHTGSAAFQTGDDGTIYRSPFDFTSQFSTAEYYAIEGGATATYTSNHPLNTASLFWGSPDTYNYISFYSGGNLLFTLMGSDLGLANYSTGHDIVTISLIGGTFDEAIFGSTSDAFEFSNLSASETPIPGTLWLFVGGLGVMGLFAWQRKKGMTAGVGAVA